MTKKSAAYLVVTMLTLGMIFPTSADAQTAATTKHDPIWDGMLIGAAVGLGILALSPRAFCDLPDPECAGIVRVVIGLPAIGVGIGVGALADGLHHQRGIGPAPFQSAQSLKVTFRF